MKDKNFDIKINVARDVSKDNETDRPSGVKRAAEEETEVMSAERKSAGQEAVQEDPELKKLAGELEELRQSMMRNQADFANYRKRIDKERTEDSRRAIARVVEGLIPVLDGFEHALAAHKEAEYEGYRKGFELIHKQLLDNLGKLGVERIEPLGRLFDPHLHQAMDRAETSEHQDGTILEVFQPGYLFHGRVLRPAMVRVAVHPKEASKSIVN